MRKITADYIVPVATAPIKNGIIITDEDGTILELIDPAVSSEPSGENIESHRGIICPGFVNTHCHLELSHLKNKVAEKTGLDEFIKGIEATRRVDETAILNAIETAEKEMIANGIVAVGDISNNPLSFAQKKQGKLRYHTFLEVFAFHPDMADRAFNWGLKLFDEYNAKVGDGRVSITPHAPYSASEKLFGMIRDHAAEHQSILTIHNQESEEENKFFLSKEGKLLRRMEHFEIDISFWKAPGRSSLQSVLPMLPDRNKLLLVHNTFTVKEDIQKAQAYNDQLYWCFCPNANLYIENQLPDFQLFMDEGCRITIGTDSLASNHGLSVLDEIKTIHRHAPEISLETLLLWATKNGAEFLDMEQELGTIEKGKKPGLNLLSNIESLQLGEETEVVPLFINYKTPESI